MQKKIKVGRLFRSMPAGAKKNEDGTRNMSFSSDDPYERHFGYEVLDHSPGAVVMGRLLNKAPLLAEHDPTKQIGVIETGSIVGTKGFVDYRFGNSALAKEYEADVDDEIRTHVSVGYIVHEMELKEKAEEGPDTYLVTKWEPLEVSFVSIAADDRVGVGRSEDADKWVRELSVDDGEPEPLEIKHEVKTMSDKSPEVAVVDNSDKERQRQADIRATAKMITDLPEARDLADQFCDNGKSVGDFLVAANDLRGKNREANPTPEIGMSEKEVKEFSILKMVRALADPSDRGAQNAAAFEFECSHAAATKAHRPARGMFVPADVVLRGQASVPTSTRDITAGPGGTGQYLIDTSQMSMIDALQNQMVVGQLGATSFNGLVGDVAFPREGTQATTYWIGEAEDVTESTPGFNQVTMSPKTAGATSDLTRKIIQQSSLSVEMWLRGHLAQKLAIAGDLAAIHGTGANGQPLGILNTSGIGDVEGGANGAAVTYAHLVALEKAVAIDNALKGRLSFVTNPKVRATLRNAFINGLGGDTPLWQGGLEGEVMGYDARATNQVSSTLLKTGSSNTGAHSAVLFGDFTSLYLGFWGGLDINVDTATLSKSGGIRVVALQDMDVAVAHVESFAAMQDATTA